VGYSFIFTCKDGTLSMLVTRFKFINGFFFLEKKEDANGHGRLALQKSQPQTIRLT